MKKLPDFKPVTRKTWRDRRLNLVEMKLVPLVRPYKKGRRSRRLRKNQWVPK
jgi:hypothetical protein